MHGHHHDGADGASCGTSSSSSSSSSSLPQSSLDDWDMHLLLKPSPRCKDLHSSEPCFYSTPAFDVGGAGHDGDDMCSHDVSTRGGPARAVRFDDYDEVFDIPHINDMSQEEKADAYMSPEQLACIRREALSLIRQLDSEGGGEGAVLADPCTRGLLQHTRAALARTMAGRYQLYDIVYEVQQWQWQQARRHGEDDPDLLARTIRHSGITERGAEQARARAMSDMVEASR
jgi:hypothetical protein